MNNLTFREIQLEELAILKKVKEYLENNNLKYFLIGGTLLGAVRHQGFIPWDDDIDICMPREDYDRFIEICNEKEIDENYVLMAYERKNSVYPFAKVVNKRIVIDSKSIEDRNLWIDIFPIDGYPDSYEESLKMSKKLNFYKGIMYLQNTQFKSIIKEKKKISNRIIKCALKPIACIIPARHISKKIIDICTKYKYADSVYVGGAVWGYGISERIEKNKFCTSAVKMKFEDEEFSVPFGYELYLKSIYGDYMELPPEENRITHGIIARKV